MSSSVVSFSVRHGNEEYEFRRLQRPVLIRIPHLSRADLRAQALAERRNDTYDRTSTTR